MNLVELSLPVTSNSRYINSHVQIVSLGDVLMITPTPFTDEKIFLIQVQDLDLNLHNGVIYPSTNFSSDFSFKRKNFSRNVDSEGSKILNVISKWYWLCNQSASCIWLGMRKQQQFLRKKRFKNFEQLKWEQWLYYDWAWSFHTDQTKGWIQIVREYSLI